MLVWLGRQMLAQRDKTEVSQDAPTLTMLHLLDAQAAGAQLAALRLDDGTFADAGGATADEGHATAPINVYAPALE